MGGHDAGPIHAAEGSKNSTYQDCSAEYLRRLVIARSGRLPKGCTRRQQFLVILRRQDSRFTKRFRFLDLPPEVRVMTYHELLRPSRYDSPRETQDFRPMRFLQILRTSQEVYDEAVDVLYSRALFKINISTDRCLVSFRVYPHFITAFNSIIGESLLDTVCAPDRILRSARYLDIHLSISLLNDRQTAQNLNAPANAELRTLHYVLYILSPWLTGNDRLRRMRFRIIQTRRSTALNEGIDPAGQTSPRASEGLLEALLWLSQ